MNKSTVLVPVVHEHGIDPKAELADPDTYRRVFTYHLPSKHCFFIKSTDDQMKPAIEKNGLALIKPLNISLPVAHGLIDTKHPRLLHHLELVAVIYKGELLLRRTYACVDTRHRQVNVYTFVHDPQDFQQDKNPILPNRDSPVKVVGKVIEVINRY